MCNNDVSLFLWLVCACVECHESPCANYCWPVAARVEINLQYLFKYFYQNH